jgi:hypothetical protein
MAQKTILQVANAIFKNPNDWKQIEDSDKKTYFFIFNRYMSKKYPEEAQFLNDKLQDEIAGMNLIHAFLSRKPYPRWFWSKSEKKAEKKSYSVKEISELKNRFDLIDAELEILTMYHQAEVKEELKYISDLKNNI